jgi:hypothetical protein
LATPSFATNTPSFATDVHVDVSTFAPQKQVYQLTAKANLLVD